MKLFPEDLLYSQEHIWIRVEGNLATIGITDHAQEKLGEIIAIDVSPEALQIAQTNADTLLTPDQRAKVRFLQGSLTRPLDEPVDLLLANLPYLTPEQREVFRARSNIPAIWEELVKPWMEKKYPGQDMTKKLQDELKRIHEEVLAKNTKK